LEGCKGKGKIATGKRDIQVLKLQIMAVWETFLYLCRRYYWQVFRWKSGCNERKDLHWGNGKSAI